MRWRTSFRQTAAAKNASAVAVAISETEGNGSIKLRRNTSLRSQNVALRMSSIHVLTFVACWTPYLVISLWHILDEDSVGQVSPIVQDALFLTAVLNSCINPFVYGGFYFKTLTAANNGLRLNSQVRRPDQHQQMNTSVRTPRSLPSIKGNLRKNGSVAVAL